MRVWSIIREILSPGQTVFRAHLTALRDEESRLIKSLHLLEDPVTRSVTTVTDRAAEFK